jgi:hypothetical protein
VKLLDQEVVKVRLLKKPFTIGTPHRLELILIFLYAVFFFIADIAQNKFLDLGTDYRVTVLSLPKQGIWSVLIGIFAFGILPTLALFLTRYRSKWKVILPTLGIGTAIGAFVGYFFINGTIKALALDVWVIFLILFHLALVGLFLMSLRSKATSRVFDVFIGIFALFGVAILLAGAIVQIYSQTIHFLFMNFNSLDFYHLGVYIEVFAGVYWALTK